MKKIILLLGILLLLPLTALAANEENRDICYRYITEVMGYNRAAACGILANIQYESNFRPTAIGDSGNAYGICQWNSRRESLKKHAYNYCLEHGEIADLDESWKNIYAQLSYLNYELENNKKSVGNYLKSLPDTAEGAYEAGYYFCVYFEIPADRYNKGVKRGATAVTTYFKLYGGEAGSYTVSYNTMGGSGQPASQIKTEGVPLTLSSLSPILPGYEFIGWAEDPMAKEAAYQPGDTLTLNRNVTLFALWARCSYSDLLLSSDEAGYTVIGYTGSASQVNIPSQIDGLPVIAIDYGAFTAGSVPSSIFIPTSVTYIEIDAFPEGVTLVCPAGSAAHSYALSNGFRYVIADDDGLKLPAKIAILEAGAFDGTSLRTLDLSMTAITALPAGCLSGCPLLKSVVLSEKVVSIAPDALPEGVTILAPEGSYAHEFALRNGYSYLPSARHDES